MALGLDIIGARRFGYGPARSPGQDAAGLLAGLDGPDTMAQRFPVPSQAEALAASRDLSQPAPAAARHRRRRRRRPGGDPGAQGHAGHRPARRLARIVETPTPFRERLTWFWADHFTVRFREGSTRGLPGAFVDEAMRPYLSRPFGEMLNAAVTHPAMVLVSGPEFLGRAAVARWHPPRQGAEREPGPRSAGAAHAGGRIGLYPGRRDAVRRTADRADRRPLARAQCSGQSRAEPGAETVLGVSYGGGGPGWTTSWRRWTIWRCGPRPPRHLAHKLAVHFVADDAARGSGGGDDRAPTCDTGGELGRVYARAAGPSGGAVRTARQGRASRSISSAPRCARWALAGAAR